MTRARARVIAVQAIVVCALLVIVFVTILRPDEENPLRSVQAPEGTEQTDHSPGDEGSEDNGETGAPSSEQGMGDGDGGQGSDGQGQDDGTGDGGAGENAPVEPETGTVVPPPIPPTGGPGIGGEGTDSPAGDQYSDTVARLIDRLYPPS